MNTLTWLAKRAQMAAQPATVDFDRIAEVDGGEDLLKSLVEQLDPLVLEELLVKYEELAKAEPPPQKHGEVHPTKPFVGAKHPTGALMWHKNPAAAQADDKEVESRLEEFVAKYPKEHQDLVRNFVRAVGAKHTRHFIPAEDRVSATNAMRPSIRQRHLVQLLRGNPIASLVASPGQVSFTLRERHGERNPGPYTWNFDGRFFEKDPKGNRVYW